MVRTNSTMQPLGTPAADFALPDTAGTLVRRSDATGRPLLVMFISNHCPYVLHVRDELVRVAREAQAGGVAVVAIGSNDPETYPDDAPARMAEEAHKAGFTFPYCHDADQRVAKAYRAACTPDLFLFDAAHRLVYRGQLDGSRPKNAVPVTGEDLRAALATLLAGRPPLAMQRPSMGCNIKWKPGNEPEWFQG